MRALIAAAAVAAIAAGAAGAMPVGEPQSNGVAFGDAGKATLVLSTDRYRLTLAKKNGEIGELLDRLTGQRLLTGQSACLWAGRTTGIGAYAGGCAFSPAGADRFSYAWNARKATLTLTYTATTASVGAVATIRAEPAALDLQLSLTSRLRNGVVRNVLFPGDLRARAGSVEAGYAPNFLPGVRLKPAFFSRIGNNINTYPSRWAFADYLALDLAGSQLALYSENPAPSRLAPVQLGFVHAADGSCSGDSFCLVHTFETWIENGENWTSPVVRLEIGRTARESILDYRIANGIDAYPSAAEKLGPLLPTLARAPLIKADLRKGLPPFASWGADLARLPSPALLHPVAYQARGHDENYPDFLPPDPAIGSNEDFRSMVGSAHALGLLVMPYANASWWNDESPTARGLEAPLTIADLAVQDNQGRPVREHFGAHSGYVVSPYAPVVRDRFARLLDEWRQDVPVDCVFLDQIGARPWLRDFNPASPTPLAYDDGWLSLVAPYRDRCLMVEDGWDRLAQTCAGFHGGLLLMDRESDSPNTDWGAGNWEPYPLADWLLHDKVLLYQHDLYEGTMTADLDVLTWNVAFGFQLSYRWDGVDGTLSSPWLQAVGAFQRTLGPLYAGKALDAFEEPAPGVTVSTFGNLTVLANWTSAPYEANGFGIAPGGFLARGPGLVAGAFSGSFEGAPLSSGTHLIVADQGVRAFDARLG